MVYAEASNLPNPPNPQRRKIPTNPCRSATIHERERIPQMTSTTRTRAHPFLVQRNLAPLEFSLIRQLDLMAAKTDTDEAVGKIQLVRGRLRYDTANPFRHARPSVHPELAVPVDPWTTLTMTMILSGMTTNTSSATETRTTDVADPAQTSSLGTRYRGMTKPGGNPSGKKADAHDLRIPMIIPTWMSFVGPEVPSTKTDETASRAADPANTHRLQRRTGILLARDCIHGDGGSRVTRQMTTGDHLPEMLDITARGRCECCSIPTYTTLLNSSKHLLYLLAAAQTVPPQPTEQVVTAFLSEALLLSARPYQRNLVWIKAERAGIPPVT